MSALSDCISKFNETFPGYDVGLPIDPRDVMAMADLSELRGEQPLADDLRAALQASLGKPQEDDNL